MAKNAAQIVTDMTALSAPTFALNADTGSSNSDGITNDAMHRRLQTVLRVGNTVWTAVRIGLLAVTRALSLRITQPLPSMTFKCAS